MASVTLENVRKVQAGSVEAVKDVWGPGNDVCGAHDVPQLPIPHSPLPSFWSSPWLR
jgi:hypothetical protein